LFPAEYNFNGIVFDGTNIWVTDGATPPEAANSVIKLRASDGLELGTFNAGGGPSGIAFDGANVWVANTRGNTVSKL
jgi:DNA-binding beta-propeller fold protein YncE